MIGFAGRMVEYCCEQSKRINGRGLSEANRLEKASYQSYIDRYVSKGNRKRQKTIEKFGFNSFEKSVDSVRNKLMYLRRKEEPSGSC